MRKLVSVAGVVVSLVAAMLIPPAATAQNEGDLRLVGGSSANEGRVEVFHAGQWGTVCDDIWSPPNTDHPENAEVVCRQLGFGPPLAAPSEAFFGEGSGPIWMDDVFCVGSEQRLVDCPFRGPNVFGDHNCAHSEDAGVICTGNGAAAPAMSATTLMLAAFALIASGAFVLRRRQPAA